MFSLKRFACDERLLVEYQKLAGSHFGERGPLEPVLNVKIPGTTKIPGINYLGLSENLQMNKSKSRSV